MTNITRTIQHSILQRLEDRKAIIVMGARQVGKTTLLHQLINDSDAMWLTGDDAPTRTLLSDIGIERLKVLIGNHKVIIIDEAQRIKNIGLTIKLIVDNIPTVKVLATGSSSFELANVINEPLTGRKWQYTLFPLSFAELTAHSNLLSERAMLEHRLVYGSYPEVVTSPADEKKVLEQLAESYVYKDVLDLGQLRKNDELITLVKALAYQIGNEVVYSELAQLCRLDSKTVEKYISILEQAYIVFRLGSFSRNLRNELRHSRKIYFYDTGIRNALINNYAPVEMRSDAGQLFENYMIVERMKYCQRSNRLCNRYFWRTTSQSEIDYIEESDGILSAFEFKWNPRRKASLPKSFSNAYPGTDFAVVNPDNYDQFLL